MPTDSENSSLIKQSNLKETWESVKSDLTEYNDTDFERIKMLTTQEMKINETYEYTHSLLIWFAQSRHIRPTNASFIQSLQELVHLMSGREIQQTAGKKSIAFT